MNAWTPGPNQLPSGLCVDCGETWQGAPELCDCQFYRTMIKANPLEVPKDMPPGVWWWRCHVYRHLGNLSDLPWFNPLLEYVNPAELTMLRAKAMVWEEEYGEYPIDISCFWEVRQARKRGDLPISDEIVHSPIDGDGILHCGKCQARWTRDDNGDPFPDSCKRCGVRWVKEGDYVPV